MALKISPDSLATLRAAVNQARAEVNFTVDSYAAQGLSAKRYRWDLLWYATAKVLPRNWVCDTLYNAENLNDTHIDSALRAIVEKQ